MRPKVVLILVLNLLPLLADTEASLSATGSLTNEHGPAADTRMKNLHPVGTRFEARPKWSLPDDAEYENSQDGSNFRHLRRVLHSRDGSEHRMEPNIADVGRSDGRWRNQDSQRISRRYLAEWGPASEMTWIRRRRPESVGRRDRRLDGWSEAGMEWIKRRGDGGRWRPGKRLWETAELSWLKRRDDRHGQTSTLNSDDDEQQRAADNSTRDITQQTTTKVNLI